MGHQYGFAASTLGPGGKFEPWLTEHPEETLSVERHWMGVHMVLDMNPYLNSGKTIQQGLKILGDFGWNRKDCQWCGFWKAKADGLYEYTPAERIYISMYRRGNQALLICLNDRPDEQEITWQPSAKLRAEGGLKDAETGETIAPVGNAWKFKLPHYNYRAFTVTVNGEF